MTDKRSEKKPRAVEGAPAISQEAVSGSVIVTGDNNVQVGSGGVAVGRGAVAAGEGGIVVGGDIHGEIFVHERPPRVLSQDQAFERIGAAVKSNLGQLERNIDKARTESSQFFKLTLVFASLGFLIVLGGVGLLLAKQVAAGIVSTISAVIPEVTAALFFKKDQELRVTIERYHQHVLDSQRLLTMIDVAETVKDETERDALKKEIVWKALGIEQSPQQGARLCENPALKSLLCFQQLLACTGPLPSPPSGDAAHMITLRPSMSQPRAAISRGISTRFNTRRRLYASTVKLNSVRTFSSPRIKK